MKEGKAVLFEGMHLDPTIYISEILNMKYLNENNYDPICIPILLTIDREEHKLLASQYKANFKCILFKLKNVCISENISFERCI